MSERAGRGEPVGQPGGSPLRGPADVAAQLQPARKQRGRLVSALQVAVAVALAVVVGGGVVVMVVASRTR